MTDLWYLAQLTISITVLRDVLRARRDLLPERVEAAARVLDDRLARAVLDRLRIKHSNSKKNGGNLQIQIPTQNSSPPSAVSVARMTSTMTTMTMITRASEKKPPFLRDSN